MRNISFLYLLKFKPWNFRALSKQAILVCEASVLIQYILPGQGNQ